MKTPESPKNSNSNDLGEAPKKPSSAYRKLRRKLSKTSLRVPHIWLRHRGFQPADVFFGSYPRSGTTWSRFTLYEILTGDESKFSAVNEGIRHIGAHHDALSMLPGGGRLISTHEQYRKEYKRAIYIVRDCRDVVLSEFAYTTALEFFHGDMDKFLRTFFCGKINPFGPWQRHVSSWLDSPIAASGDLLVVRYENLRRDPVKGFTRVAEFLGADVGDERIRRAITNNGLDRMREKERLEPQRASVKGRFVRNGLVQGWRSQLSPEQLEFIEKHAGNILQRLALLDQETDAAVSVGAIR